MFRLRLINDKTNINFMGMRKFSYAFSILLTVIMFTLLFTRGFNLGIDFTGGVLMEVKMPAGTKIEDIRHQLATLSAGEPSIQDFGQDSVMIKIPGKETDAEGQKALRAEVGALLGDGADFRRIEFVGPQVGGELIVASIKAFVYSMIGILIYIWVRFEWQFGLVAVVGLAHDIMATMLFFLVTQLEFSLSTVAAALLIAGYSINETVVVFDRIRETMRKYKKMPMGELINMSINEVLSRTAITFVLTFIALLSLVLFGGHVIRSFAYAMLAGILFGPYSSMLISATLLSYMNLRQPTVDKEEAVSPEGQTA